VTSVETGRSYVADPVVPAVRTRVYVPLERRGRFADTVVAVVAVTVTAVPPIVIVGATHGVAHRPVPLMLTAVGVPAAE
jgi:hypothetical protein